MKVGEKREGIGIENRKRKEKKLLQKERKIRIEKGSKRRNSGGKEKSDM